MEPSPSYRYDLSGSYSNDLGSRYTNYLSGSRPKWALKSPGDPEPERDPPIEFPSFICHVCGAKCKRRQDLERHLKATKKHSKPEGPVCPEPGCRFKKRFTRVDNFRAHYMRQHGKDRYETNDSLQGWEPQDGPKAYGGSMHRAAMRKRKNTARTPTSGI